MNILIIGSGGREHAFAWKIKQSVLCKELYVAPGNPGIDSIATCISISVDDFDSIGKFCLEKKINLVVVGPEVPLVKGIVNYFTEHPLLKSIFIIGPTKEGALLEGSKEYAKSFMNKYFIPTANYKSFTNETFEEGIKYINSHSLPIVLKADGLAAGKGVSIAQSNEEAQSIFTEIVKEKKFGNDKIVIEEFLNGIEVSVFVVTDGINYKILPVAKDYKRIGEDDTGANTGGMGAVSPVNFVDDHFLQKVCTKIIEPTLKGLQQEKINYKGFLFLGLMKVNDEPYVIEYNCRMGDPETEVVLPRIKSDLVELCLATARGELVNYKLEIRKETAVAIVTVSGGYPDQYEKGNLINGLEKIENALVFHAGTSHDQQKRVITNSGRVLVITSLHENLQDAISLVYEEVKKITWKDQYYRKDIGKDLVSLINK